MQSPDLTDAIDALYDAFAGYARPATFYACGCCFEGRDVPGARWNNTSRPLVEVDAPGGDLPLRAVEPNEALAELGTDVPLTGGDLALFKHYLPRLFEIVTGAGFENDWPELWLIASHLSLREELGVDPWWNWPEREQSALQAFLDRGVADGARRGTPEETDDTLGAIALAAPAIQPYLDAWIADTDAASVANLVEFTDTKKDTLAVDEPHVFWWSRSGDEPGTTNLAHLVAWLNP